MTLLLVHTGGTIGMAPTAEGLAPQAGLVESALAARLPEGRALQAEVFDPLIDSADMGPDGWNRIIGAVLAHPGADVIVTHGTDTMAFTGAALSQALAGSGRRVVLCGSMLPLGMGGDAEGNLDLAIQAAGTAAPWPPCWPSWMAPCCASMARAPQRAIRIFWLFWPMPRRGVWPCARSASARPAGWNPAAMPQGPGFGRQACRTAGLKPPRSR